MTLLHTSLARLTYCAQTMWLLDILDSGAKWQREKFNVTVLELS